MYSKKVIFYIPSFCGQFNLCETLAFAYRNKKEYFYDNVEIGAFYDCPNIIWNGGRQLIDKKYDLKAIRNVFNYYQIPLRLTFTNGILRQEHLLDIESNQVTKIFNTGKNEVLYNSDLLYQYLKSLYGDNYKYISSITKCLRTDFQKQNEEINKSSFLTVLDFDWNNQFDKLEKIQQKEKCEILVNPSCIPKCPYREKHYQYISEMELYGHSNIKYTCGSSALRYYELQKYPHYISPQDIEKIYLPMGFNHFKLEGRQMNDLELIEVIVDYLIKDEYKLEVRSNLQSANHPINGGI